MKAWLFEKMIPMAISYLLSLAPADVIRELVDKVFDLAEDFVMNSETKIDDAVVLPILAQLREAFNIPDND